MALKSETASPPDGMVNVINQESGIDGDDLEDGEIFDDEDDTPIPPAPSIAPQNSTSPVVAPPAPAIGLLDDRKKLDSPVRKGIPPRQRKGKRAREEERPFKSNKQRRRSEESEKSREKGITSDDEDMRELSPLRLGSDWDRGHHRPIFLDDLDDDDDDLLRRGRGFGNRNRRGRNGRGGGGRRGMGRRENGQICKFFLQGKCQRGGECPFSHRKYEVCKFYMNDCCAKKDRCLFMHGEFPCKYHFLGLKCYAGKKCKFSHGKISSQMRLNLLRDSKECDFLQQHMESPPPKEEGRARRERERERDREREHREREHREKERDRERDKERERARKEDKDRFTLHFKVDPRTVSDEEEGNRTPMPSPSPESRSDRGSHSPELNVKNSPKLENSAPEPKDNGISDEFPDFIPADLPKHQRELYKRIQQQQREVKNVKTEEDDLEKEGEDYKEEDWYSSEEEDKRLEPITALLNRLKQNPSAPRQASPPKQAPSQIVVPPILPEFDISTVSKILSTIQQKQQKKDGPSDSPVPSTPLALGAATLSMSTAPGMAPSSTDSASSVPADIPPSLNPLPPLSSLVSEPGPPPEKRRMRDPRLRGNSTEDDIDLRVGPRGDVDLRQLPFKPAPIHTPANEIEASVTSHPPVIYRLVPISPPSPPDYTHVHSKNVNDPRLRKHIPGALSLLQPMLPPGGSGGGARAPPAEGPRDPRQRALANDPRRKSSLLLQRDSDLRQPPHTFNLVNDVDLRMHPPPPHLAFK